MRVRKWTSSECWLKVVLDALYIDVIGREFRRFPTWGGAFVMRAEVSKTLAMLNQLQQPECLCLYPPYLSLTSTHPNPGGLDGGTAALPLNE